MKYKEIGSEFWDFEISHVKEFEFHKDVRYSLTGRTALIHIIKDILSLKKIKRVSLPNYLCHTMIVPFQLQGIECYFYDIQFYNGEFHHLDSPEIYESDIVLIMDYFGFKTSTKNIIIDKAKKNNCIVIEDNTHDLFSFNNANTDVDYSFNSFRKWTGLAAGSIIIKKGKFNIDCSNVHLEKYTKMREAAKIMKKDYIFDKNSKNKNYLFLFKDAEELLENNYFDYDLSEKYISSIKEIDYKKISTKRISNAKKLIDVLSEKSWVSVPRIKDGDIPLFVPVFVHESVRKNIMSKLKESNIFCPIHWPLSTYHEKFSNHLYYEEISLICDQRYDESDLSIILKIFDEIGEEYDGL